MNRIILIGNGFDLAHGMATSYKNFIDDYWDKAISKIVEIDTPFEPFENEEFSIKETPDYFNSTTYESLKNSEVNRKPLELNFKNLFFQEITKKNNIQSWVDVEEEYYKLLIDASKLGSTYSIEKLNKDFKDVKNLLSNYLSEIENSFRENFNGEIRKTFAEVDFKISNSLSPKDLSEKAFNQLIETKFSLIKSDIDLIKEGKLLKADIPYPKNTIYHQLDLENPLLSIRKLLLQEGAENYFDLSPDNFLFLNFNYTNTQRNYDSKRFSRHSNLREIQSKFINIHGKINDPKNPMIFGFGDELDDEYSSIEKLNNNKYLENIKSINYLETNNYKRLLEYINSDNFQIFIFGHSCGISDRTLLNTLFEHENCASIKVYYHKRDDGSDNYSDIVRNISRNFNDKALMRDRVVNKNYCEPLLDIKS